jgi:hypothetical protein
MRALLLLPIIALSVACGGSASPEKCLKVAEHVVSLSVKNAAGEAGAKAGSTDELLAGVDAAKSVADEMRNSPQFKKIHEGCQKVPESVADCMLGIKDIKDMGSCQPR